MSARTLLVTGASGQLGRLVLDRLLALKTGDRLVAGTRNPDSLKAYADQGVEVRKVDFDDTAASLAQAFAGVDRLLIVSTDALDRPGRRQEQQVRAVQAAKAAGVGHLLYTSIAKADAANPGILAADHRGTEHAIAHSGIPYTFLRNNWYFENLLGDLAYAAQSGILADATGTGRVAYATRQDCAFAAAGALAAHESKSSVRDISGPELLSRDDLARALSEFAGKPVASVGLSLDERKAGLEAAGLPAGFAHVIADSEDAMAKGWLALQSDDVALLSGTAPTGIKAFLEANRATLGL